MLHSPTRRPRQSMFPSATFSGAVFRASKQFSLTRGPCATCCTVQRADLDSPCFHRQLFLE